MEVVISDWVSCLGWRVVSDYPSFYILFLNNMECTLIKDTNGRYEVQYGLQHLTQSRHVAEYKFVNLTEQEVERIRNAATEDVQRILSELY